MYIQWCAKGITSDPTSEVPLDWHGAKALVSSGQGLVSNWWRGRTITPAQVADVLNVANLYRHLNDYDVYGPRSPFISLAAGSVERDRITRTNRVTSAVEMAVWFATREWSQPGAVFYCWTPVGLNPAVEVSAVSEAVRDLHVYRDYLPFQPEGEITAKIGIPANQIQRVEWWDPAIANVAVDVEINPDFVEPMPLTTLREFF